MFDQAETLRNLMNEIKQTELHGKILNKDKSSPRVLVTTGGKGGIGKSIITANVATNLAKSGFKVLLIDADFGLANLDVLLDIPASYSLEDVLNHSKDLKDVICQKQPNLYLLPASSGFVSAHELTQTQQLLLMDQFETFEQKFDYIFIDSPAGVSRNVQYWIKTAGDVLLVTTPEPTSLADAYATMKILRHTTTVNRFKLILNMAQSEEEALRVFDRLATFAFDHLEVHLTYLGHVLSDNIVKQSVRERCCVVEKFPFSDSARQLRAISQQLVRECEDAESGLEQSLFWKKWISRKKFEQNLSH